MLSAAAASPALPGSAHDLTAARTHGLIEVLTSADVMAISDRGYQGARGSVRTPFKRRRSRPNLSRRREAVNRAHAKIWARGEPAIATLKTWRSSPSYVAARAGRPPSCGPSSSCTTSKPAATQNERGSLRITGRILAHTLPGSVKGNSP
ncbi:hypothetical protein Aca07nite_39140 [Actinoplanes capillaceus]|uniref:DDE Tnp4 domain-containing protein n=1 Tax=Actinoplanes campanulatus TaxID=113559 RepID=A0ABQ3WK72_9ACTN|nr:hypothetical protein Aca07nite_39140 [Actinoplanes capillaceus]